MKSTKHSDFLRTSVLKRATAGERIIGSMFPNRGTGWPGGWSQDRVEQVMHMKNWTYVAVNAIASKIGSIMPNMAYVTDREGQAGPKGRVVKACQRFPGQFGGTSEVSSFDGGHSFLTMGAYRSKALSVVKPHEDLEPLENDHPLRRLFELPNPVDTSFNLLYELQMFEELTGVSYLWAIPNRWGVPCELWVLPSHWVWPRTGSGKLVDNSNPHSDELIEYYEIRPWGGIGSAGTLRIDPHEIICNRWPSPVNKLDGYSKLQAIAQWIDSEESISKSRWSQFQNQARPELWIELGAGYEDPDDDRIARVEAKIMNKFMGEYNYGKPIVSPPGSKLTPLSFNPTEMAYFQSEEQIRDMILSTFGVPKTAVGIVGEMTYGSLLASLAQFCAYCLNIRLAVRGQSLTKDLASRWNEGNRKVKLWWDDCVPADPTQVNADISADLAADAITPNEVRLLRGRKPYEKGGDDPMTSGPGGRMPIPLNTGEDLTDLAELLKPMTNPEPPAQPGAPGEAAPGGDQPTSPEDKAQVEEGEKLAQSLLGEVDDDNAAPQDPPNNFDDEPEEEEPEEQDTGEPVGEDDQYGDTEDGPVKPAGIAKPNSKPSKSLVQKTSPWNENAARNAFKRECPVEIGSPYRQSLYVIARMMGYSVEQAVDAAKHPENNPKVVRRLESGKPFTGPPKKAYTKSYTFDSEDCPECGASMEGDSDSGKCNSCGELWGTPIKSVTKEGFSGKRRGQDGKTRCYTNGVPTPCPDNEEEEADKEATVEEDTKVETAEQTHKKLGEANDKLGEEVQPKIDEDPKLGNIFSRVTKAVIDKLKAVVWNKMTETALKACDNYLFEQVIEAQQPGMVMATKVAVFAGVKAYQGVRAGVKKLRGKSHKDFDFNDFASRFDDAVRTYTEIEKAKPPLEEDDEEFPAKWFTKSHDEIKIKTKAAYGYKIGNDFRCVDCADGFDEEDRDHPINEQPWLGFRCNGCGQYYLGDQQWGTKPPNKSISKAGTCKPGQTAARTGCTPAEGGGGKKPGKGGDSESGSKAMTGIKRNSDGSYTGGSREQCARAKALKLPPAWKNVTISQDPKAKLQAMGTDKKGRTQRLYSAEHSQAQAAEKFGRVKAMVQKLPTIDKALRANLGKSEEAAALLLMRKTGFRIGGEGDTKADKQALGATTLTSKNVKIDGSTVSFDFIGKKGVRIKQEVNDPELAKVLAPRVKNGGKLFDTNDASVRQFFGEIAPGFKPKDLRTVVATETALDALMQVPNPGTDNEALYKKAKLKVAAIVARKLGNTPTIALASYIPPEVFDNWKSEAKKKSLTGSDALLDFVETTHYTGPNGPDTTDWTTYDPDEDDGDGDDENDETGNPVGLKSKLKTKSHDEIKVVPLVWSLWKGGRWVDSTKTFDIRPEDGQYTLYDLSERSGPPLAIGRTVDELKRKAARIVEEWAQSSWYDYSDYKSYTKAKGSCKPGQTAANTDCTPASGEGGGKESSEPELTPKNAMSKLVDIGKKVLSGASDLEHGAKELAKAQFAKLPDKVRAPVAGFLKAFYGTYVVAQATADKVAQKNGMDDAGRQHLASVLTAIDCIGMKTNAAIGSAIGGPAVGGAASFLPIASTAYLAFSAAKHPFQVLEAAKEAISEYMQSFKPSKSRKSKDDDKDLLAEALMRVEDDRLDRWSACFSAALDAGVKTVKDAITLANQAYNDLEIDDE